jgi:hypothetical protein
VGPIPSWYVYLVSVFPLMGALQMCDLCVRAANLNVTVTLTNMFTQPIYLYSPGIVLIAQICCMLFFTLLLLYLWPLTVSFDPENRLPWYYLC